MSKKRVLPKVFSAVLVLLVIIFFINAIVSYTGIDTKNLTNPKIVVIKLEGIILNSDKFLNAYKKFHDNPNVKGFVIRINSPGGAVAPSQEIYRILRKIDKPVFVSMSTLAASGGYYVAAASDKIFALEGTLTGSIGVIMKFTNMSELYEKIGVQIETVKSGKFKDIGASNRSLTEAERKILQNTIDQVYESFIHDILKARKIKEETLRAYADGRVITGKKALEIGLVDEIGGFYDTVESLKKQIGMKDIDLYYYKEKENVLDNLLNGITELKSFFTADKGYKLYYLNDNL
ncbi:signal peptide peptidase SppA, 36K type [Flexistipes sinusarabici DSM 4947]|uniref:Signal peptide peptidase SppA, 36K type n=3 Tax=Flexistipes sinusarabici TaxID=2352 RepID=F8E3X1_FLESM|nr:signal peptide peptidase SppA [Flexistipes sinusarabici]AEI15473.1 signal peptide peptidase SppA, 36K type [Flexistipes sinusarabici DSM 4947]